MSDTVKEQEMGINNRLIHQKPPVVQYDTRLPTWKEMQEVVRAIRSASAPGPSGVPYIVYKRCKGILQNSVEDIESHLEERQDCGAIEIRWGGIDPEGGRFEVIGPIPNNFIIKHWK